MNNSLKILLTVTDVDIQTPSYKPIGTTTNNCIIAKRLNEIHFFATQEFFKLIKLGCVDLTMIDKGFNKFQCLLITIAFGNFMLSNKLDLFEALVQFTASDMLVLTKYMSANNIKDIEKFNKMGLVKSIDFLSTQINRKIVVISKSSRIKCHNEIVYMSKNFKNLEIAHKMPIYVLLDKSHALLAYNFKLQRNSKFCYICVKNISKTGYHKCKLQICRLCKRYVKHKKDIHTNDTCTYKSIVDTDITCQHCKNKFTNMDCYKHHLSLKKKGKYCVAYYRCDVCNMFVKNGSKQTHKHNHRFCLTCKKYHPTTELCYISGHHFNKTKQKNTYYFLHLAMSKNLTPFFAIIAQMTNDKKIIGDKLYLSNEYIGKHIESLSDSTISLETIVSYITSVKIAHSFAQKVQIFCCTETLKFLLNQINCDTSEILFGKNSKVNGFKVANIYFKTIEAFIDVHPHILAFLLDKNMATVVLPDNLTAANIRSNAYITVTHNNYATDQYIGSRIEHFNKLKKDISEIDIKDYAQSIFMQMSTYQCDLYLASIYKLIQFYDSLKHMLSIKPKSFLFEHSTLSQCANYIYRAVTPEDELPIVNMEMSNAIRNGSKIEFCVAEMLTELHMITCRDESKLHSAINNDGMQFRKRNLTADFHCSKCNYAYFINGLYKTENCTFGHRQNMKSTFFGKTKTQMSDKFKTNLTTFMDLTDNKLIPVIFPQCCILSKAKLSLKMHILKLLVSRNIPSAKLLQTKLINSLNKSLKTYSRDRYRAINYRECTNKPMVSSLNSYFLLNASRDNLYIIQKYDLVSAFPNQFKSMILPYRDGGKKYVFRQANQYLDQIIAAGTHVNITGFCRAHVLTPNTKYTRIFPFFAYTNESTKESTFTMCRTCSINQTNSANCNHSDLERSFYINTTIESIIFAKLILKYDVNLTEIYVYENTKQYKGFIDVIDAIDTLRKTNQFYKHMGKKCQLQGIGSFSVDINKYSKNKCLTTYSGLAAQLTSKNNKPIAYSFFGNSQENPQCVISSQNNVTYKKFKCAKINTLIYTLASNKTRIQLYKAIMMIIDKFPKSILLRLDADALTLSLLQRDKYAIETLLSKVGFKLESSAIKGVISFKQKSYMLLYEDNYNCTLKTCGLSLSLNERFSIDYQSLAEDYLKIPIKHQSKLRILDSQLTKNKYFECLQSYPYGATGL